MSRRIRKPKERRSEILNAARHLFEAKGYDQTTMQDLMQCLTIAKGTIYHYFQSKEELLEAVIADIVAANCQKMEACLEEKQGTALDKMKALVAIGNIAAENVNILHHLHRPGNEAMHLRLFASTLIKQAPIFGKLIQQGCEEGVFQTESPLECAEFILSAVQFLTDVGFYPWTQEELVRRIKALPTLVEQLLKAPPGSFQFLTALEQN